MKITKNGLQQIINEEVERFQSENPAPAIEPVHELEEGANQGRMVKKLLSISKKHASRAAMRRDQGREEAAQESMKQARKYAEKAEQLRKEAGLPSL